MVQRGACEQALHLAGKGRPSSHGRAEALAQVAECYQASGKAERAIALYRTIAKRFRRTPTAYNALFEIGRLESARGRMAPARRAFRRYLARNRRAPLAADARFRLCRMDIDAKHYRSAMRCLRAYRRSFPRGTRSNETLYLEARLRKDARNDCRGALRLYARFLKAAKNSRSIEAAYFGQLDCLRRLGHQRFGAAARRFLSRYPGSKHRATVARWVKDKAQ